eukprot:2326136-Lingulodinium_polyedra.AAC.1
MRRAAVTSVPLGRVPLRCRPAPRSHCMAGSSPGLYSLLGGGRWAGRATARCPIEAGLQAVARG